MKMSTRSAHHVDMSEENDDESEKHKVKRRGDREIPSDCEGRGEDEIQARVQREGEELRIQRQIRSESEEKLSLLQLAASCVVEGERNVFRALLARGEDIEERNSVSYRSLHNCIFFCLSVALSLTLCFHSYSLYVSLCLSPSFIC